MCNAVICDCRQRIESSLRQEGIAEDLKHEEEVSEAKEKNQSWSVRLLV